MAIFKNRSGAFPSFTTTKNLCTPAFIYFALSILGLLVIMMQNLGNRGIYCLGPFRASVPSIALMFVMKLIYILFWTWILNLICRDGHTNVAWLLVALPFIAVFLIMMSASTYEGFVEGNTNKKSCHEDYTEFTDQQNEFKKQQELADKRKQQCGYYRWK